MKRIAAIVAVTLGIITLFVVTWQLRQIVLLFIISLTLAAVARAPIDFLIKRRIPRALAKSRVRSMRPRSREPVSGLVSHKGFKTRSTSSALANENLP